MKCVGAQQFKLFSPLLPPGRSLWTTSWIMHTRSPFHDVSPKQKEGSDRVRQGQTVSSNSFPGIHAEGGKWWAQTLEDILSVAIDHEIGRSGLDMTLFECLGGCHVGYWVPHTWQQWSYFNGKPFHPIVKFHRYGISSFIADKERTGNIVDGQWKRWPALLIFQINVWTIKSRIK